MGLGVCTSGCAYRGGSLDERRYHDSCVSTGRASRRARGLVTPSSTHIVKRFGHRLTHRNSYALCMALWPFGVRGLFGDHMALRLARLDSLASVTHAVTSGSESSRTLYGIVYASVLGVTP